MAVKRPNDQEAKLIEHMLSIAQRWDRRTQVLSSSKREEVLGNWQNEHGGLHELWADNGTTPLHLLQEMMNRLIFLETTVLELQRKNEDLNTRLRTLHDGFSGHNHATGNYYGPRTSSGPRW